jgi:hypothetical protein
MPLPDRAIDHPQEAVLNGIAPGPGVAGAPWSHHTPAPDRREPLLVSAVAVLTEISGSERDRAAIASDVRTNLAQLGFAAEHESGPRLTELAK